MQYFSNARVKFYCTETNYMAISDRLPVFEEADRKITPLAEKTRERGIHLVWVSHALFDPRVISRQGVRNQINSYMRTVMQEEPVDPSLETLDDAESW